MYYRTNSILPGVAFHWVNNSVAYVLYNIFPDPDLKLADLFPGSPFYPLMAVGFSLIILLPAIFQLHVWMKKE
jgi:membrane protease YdiL (CAAX protease family)